MGLKELQRENFSIIGFNVITTSWSYYYDLTNIGIINTFS